MDEKGYYTFHKIELNLYKYNTVLGGGFYFIKIPVFCNVSLRRRLVLIGI